MFTIRIFSATSVAIAILLGGLSTSVSLRAAEGDTGADVERSVTVFPVPIRPGKNTPQKLPKAIAGVVGIFLERAGLEEIEIAETTLPAPETDNPKQTAAALAKFIKKNPIKTNYALYAELHGTPGTGLKAIHTILVDKQGKMILADRDNEKTYAKTSKATPKDPMSSSLFVATKLQKLWGLADPLRENAPHGKMAQRLREESGLPPEKELEAIRQRQADMVEHVATRKCAVQAVRVMKNNAPKETKRLVTMINEEGVFAAVLGTKMPTFTIPGSHNEQRVLWDTARAFQAFVKKNPPKADYTLFAHYGVGKTASGTTRVGHVHTIVCDREGQWVVVDFQNSHHDDFQAVDPESVEDCHRLLIRRAKGLLANRRQE